MSLGRRIESFRLRNLAPPSLDLVSLLAVGTLQLSTGLLALVPTLVQTRQTTWLVSGLKTRRHRSRLQKVGEHCRLSASVSFSFLFFFFFTFLLTVTANLAYDLVFAQVTVFRES